MARPVADLGKQIAGLEALAKRTGSRLYGYSVRDGHARGMFEDRRAQRFAVDDPGYSPTSAAAEQFRETARKAVRRGTQGSLFEAD